MVNSLRDKVWFIINTIQANQLYVHSDTLKIQYAVKTKGNKEKIESRELPEILTICVLNALVPNSAMLLIGGHGGGKTSIVKYLGRMFTGISLGEAEECILRAHPQLTEEKIIATLDIAKLVNKGEEKVIWRKFSSSFWKIIDEVNRCSPYTQNILLSLLAEGKIKYYDSVLNMNKYCLYATLNPNDVGTFEMSGPFLDRFGISIPIAMPKTQDLAVILGGKDEKLGGYDELIEVPEVLSEEQLLNIWYEVSQIPSTPDAQNFIHSIIREFTLCTRIDKGNSDYLKPSSGLCTGCHFNIPEKVPCSNVDSILSVRVAKDLLRYSRALTWLLGLPEVTINIVTAIAPYVISHRVKYIDRYINKSPYWGSKNEFTKKLLDLVLKRFKTRKKAYDIIQSMREGKKEQGQLPELRNMAKNDLIVDKDLIPLAEKLFTSQYQKMINEIEQAHKKTNVKKLSDIRNQLLVHMDWPNRGELISYLNDILKKLTLHTYNCSQQVWNSIRFTIDSIFPQFTEKLRQTTQERGTYRLRSKDIEIEINITGIKPLDFVNFSFYGGEIADQLKKKIEKSHKNELKTMDELMDEVNIAKADEGSNDSMEKTYIQPSGTTGTEGTEGDDDILDEDFFQS